jgi:hypothetical protein
MHHEQLIELLQVHGNGPSPFHDSLNRPIVGLQRLAALTDAIEADTKRAVDCGLERFADGRDPSGQRYVYFRSANAPGVILELLEATPFFNDFLGRLAARARGYGRSGAPAAPVLAAPPPAAAGSRLIRAALLISYGEPEQFWVEEVPEPHLGRASSASGRRPPPSTPSMSSSGAGISRTGCRSSSRRRSAAMSRESSTRSATASWR